MKKYKKLEQVVEQLKGAVKAHGKQAEIVEDHIEDMHKKKAKGGPYEGYGPKLPVMGTGGWAGKRVPGMYKTGGSTPAWQRKEGQSPSGGLNAKGRASLKAKGQDIKAPVTEDKPTGKRKTRKKSFCARMRGMRKRQKPSNNTGKDRLSLSLKKWNC